MHDRKASLAPQPAYLDERHAAGNRMKHGEMDRVQKLLFRIDRSMKVLEIGPSYNPIAPKSQGWNSWSVDHANQEELKEKYRSDASVDVSRIEAVDFMWHSGDLYSAVPAEHHNTFSACVASHVIEHFPNPIGFFRSMSRLITAEGVISLAVPDKRFCFDYFKPISLTGDLLYADYKSRTRHSKCTAFNHVAYSVFSDNVGAWAQHPVRSIGFVHSIDDAKKTYDAADEDKSGPYIDYHGWFYTPSSFMLAMIELNYLNIIDWTLDSYFPTVGCEFFITLKKGKTTYASESDFNDQRLALLKDILGEVRTQQEYLIEQIDDNNQAARSDDSRLEPQSPDDDMPHTGAATDLYKRRLRGGVGNPRSGFANVAVLRERLLRIIRIGQK